MVEYILNNKFNILFSLVLILLLISFLFPLDRFLSKLLKTHVKSTYIFSALIIVGLGILFNVSKIDFILTLPMVVFSLFVFLLGFLSDRRYIYLLALISLGLTPVMLILKMDGVAEFFAQTCYLLLVLGVLKDIFYEKIFK